MQIHGFNKLTLLDYPGHLAATIFLGGCNLRCPFCHNASLVTRLSNQPTIPREEVLDTLSKRKNVLEGVCITGGEPTLYKELPAFIREIKEMGFMVKLDTNGTNPLMMKQLTDEKLIDYIAMDIKNSREKYASTAGISNLNLAAIEESVSFLLSSPLDYEFRTTIVKEFHAQEDMLSIGKWLSGAKAYYLQSYKDSGDVIQPGLNSHSKETLLDYVYLLTPYIRHVSLRGID
ncbi:MAG TPA: anaerobic ribonucleoside-triphosphate reductase activating protein [Mobilitalea sp.]|nr:anaerobic ribonucleoside-triphosphate reductase activating protein [Mobilitalea sp.]